MKRLLVLRPEPGAGATVAKARELGLDAVAVPLFRIVRLEWEAPDPANFDGLLLTSANAVRYGGEQLKDYRGLPVYAVGDATGQAARDAGFDIASAGDAGVDRLLGSIESELRLLHLSGEHRRDAPQAPQQITAVPVYRSDTKTDPDVGDITASVALVHSPRAARRFAEIVTARSETIIAAISEAAADACGDGWKHVQAAEKPTDEALLALAAQLCNKPDL